MKDKVFYSDFGAVGDGIANDFYAIREAHAYANKNGLPVHAERGKTYRFASGSGTDTITIMTDTYWHGARLVFDDADMQPDMPEYRTPIFTVSSDHQKRVYDAETSPIKSAFKESKNIGFRPGFCAMVVLYNDEVRQYIRNAGVISDNGTSQHEFVMVDADGNIDSGTPLQWNYEKITRLEVINVEDSPITISGDEEGQGVIETISNHSREDDKYLLRVIKIERSNTAFKNVHHVVSCEDLSDQGAPYEGFTHIHSCENIRFENLTLQRYKVFNTYYRSYEIRGTLANNVSWYNCNMSNFFADDGYTVHQGMMGTNYCKNLSFDNVEFNTFDCHHGCYNVTIKNSRLVYISAIGEGTLRIENCEFYICSHGCVVWLRSDYGSTWYGDLIMKDVTVKYSDRNSAIILVNSWWEDHWFGYQAKLPTTIILDGLKIIKYEAETLENGKRIERALGGGAREVSFFHPQIYDFLDVDISEHVSRGGYAENNPYRAPRELLLSRVDISKIRFPNTPMFKDTKLVVEGEKYDWRKA